MELALLGCLVSGSLFGCEQGTSIESALTQAPEPSSIAIRPEPGYVVDDVQVDGVSVGPVTSYTFSNVTADHTIYATFKKSETGEK